MIDLLKRQHIPDYLLTDILIAPPDVPVFPVVGCESELFGYGSQNLVFRVGEVD